MINKKIIILFVVISTSITACDGQPVVVKPFTVLNKTDTLINNNKIKIHCTENFLLKNYSDKAYFDRAIDSFIYKNLSPNYKTYAQYSILVYKESDRTNTKGNPYADNISDRYTRPEDRLLEYVWFNGHFAGKSKIVGGNYAPDPNNKVKIEDIKP